MTAALLTRLAFSLLLAITVVPAFAADLPSQATDQVRALVKARHQAMLSSEIAGRIVHLDIHRGETFKKGERLVEFECARFQAAQGAAKAELDHAQVRLSGMSGAARFLRP